MAAGGRDSIPFDGSTGVLRPAVCRHALTYVEEKARSDARRAAILAEALSDWKDWCGRHEGTTVVMDQVWARARRARYREANREKVRAANRAYCRRRKAHRAATLAKWVAKNKERMRGLQKAWREKHRGAAKLRAQHAA